MIKLFKYIYQFLYYSRTGRYNFISFFPIVSIIIGTIVILLTLGVMDGMEGAIFKKIKSFHFTYTGNLVDKNFIDNNFDLYIGQSRKYLISNNYNNKVVTITSLSNFDHFKENYMQEYLFRGTFNNDKKAGIIIGKGLANDLNVKIGNKITITSPLDIDIFSLIAPTLDVYVSGIFNYQILDYDYNYAFISSENFIVPNIENNQFFLKSKNNYNDYIPLYLINKYNFISWEDKHGEFLKALNTEKLLYSSFGYSLIFIAALSSISLMSLFVIKKTKQLAILKTFGCSNSLIMRVFIFNAIFCTALGIFLGGIISLFIIIMNYKFYFIQNIFFNNLIFDFSIDFNYRYIISMFIVSGFLMIAAVLYPIKKAFNIGLINSLNDKW